MVRPVRNGALRRLRVVASIASMSVAVLYVFTGGAEFPMLLALIGWNLTTLGLYHWNNEDD